MAPRHSASPSGGVLILIPQNGSIQDSSPPVSPGKGASLPHTNNPVAVAPACGHRGGGSRPISTPADDMSSFKK
ncbi:LOW QUALITY PROTEIN: hypothetical protein U9M48_040902 [Paspalum notatum var. saurae]|uniref:Uncharacterized protein n=1 Tax=Paspalum notatum var. saurae TaxID=547442 RepID=A0AAQ3XDP3_PASNO